MQHSRRKAKTPQEESAVKLRCVRCGSKRMIPRAHVMDRGDGNLPLFELTLQVYRNPTAFFFKGGKTMTICARVCGDCGHVELYVEEPEALYKSQEVLEADPDAEPVDASEPAPSADTEPLAVPEQEPLT